MAEKILVVDDEASIAKIIAYNLKKEGYEVITANDGEAGLEFALKEDPDLILLDIMMPKMDGYEVCRKIRAQKDTPIIMLTARADEIDKVNGLEIGADDYVTKPFGNRELIARVKAHLRRKQAAFASSGEGRAYGDITMDFERMEAQKRGVPLALTIREFELLKFLATNQNKIFSREDLLEKVWGYAYYGDLRAVDVTIRRLREKLEDEPSKPKYIMTKRAVGYYFAPQE